MKTEKAAFENIIRSAAAQINRSNNASSLWVALLWGNQTLTTNKIVPQWPLVGMYLPHPTSCHNSNDLRNAYGGNEFKAKLL